MLSRRLFLKTSSATLAAVSIPGMALADPSRPRRFVFIIQRGAADGLSILGPTGDPTFHAMRGDFDSDLEKGTPLQSFFTLHPALSQTAKMYADRQALFVHAVASPYRDRSHFDGQNVLETGGSSAYALRDGWLNRLVGLLPSSESSALALSDTVPMALRGRNRVSSFAPSKIQAPSNDLLERVGNMYDADPQLHVLWSEALKTQMTAGNVETAGGDGAAIGSVAAKLLSGDGANIAMIETNGWDTHSGQKGRLSAQLKNLDAILGGLKSGLGEDWSNTLVIVATEFGRTAHPNGTGGTDHGEASLAMLVGGAVSGGRVVADWPGLSTGSLFEGRDLKPTTDLDALIAGAVAQHYALEPSRVMTTLFPDTRGKAYSAKLIA